MDESSGNNSYKISPEEINSPIHAAVIKTKTYKNLNKRGSIYKLFSKNVAENAKNNVNEINQLMIKLSNDVHKNLNFSRSNNSISSSQSKTSKLNSKSSYTKLPPLSKRNQTHYLPIKTTISQHLDNLLKDGIRKEEYYKNIYSEEKYGLKKKRINEAHLILDKKDIESNIAINGLNDSFTNTTSIANKQKLKFVEVENSKFKLLKNAYENKNTGLDPSHQYKNLNGEGQLIQKKFEHYKDDPLNLRKKEIVFSIMKRDEFQNFLVERYLKKIIKNYQVKSQNKRRLYIIRDSSVITNPKKIPGVIVTIPNTLELSKYSIIKRKNLYRKFLDYLRDKMNSLTPFHYIFLKNGSIIYDLIDIKPPEKYLYVSPNSNFLGLSIPISTHIIKLYLQHFSEEDNKNGCFDYSSLDESMRSESSLEEDRDDLFDIFFSNKNIQKKFKKVIRKKKNNKLNNTFTLGINEKEKEEFIYFSDDESRKKNLDESIKIYKTNRKKIDLFIEAKNNIYEKKINSLLKNLSNNPNSKLSSKKIPFPNDIKLMSTYLTESKIPEKRMLKSTQKNIPLKNQDIVDCFNILNQDKKFLKKGNFYLKRKNEKKDLPYVEENTLKMQNKYIKNYKKTSNDYPSLISYNIPLILSKNNKLTRNEFIGLYTKFKSLVNLWFNMHDNFKILQSGIDFETFHKCNSDLCGEEEILVRKIYDEINTGASGMLTLEDYVDALTTMYRKDLIDQLEFFLRVFNMKGKHILTYDDVLHICQISIKRLITNNKNDISSIAVIKSISKFFANYMFELCNSNLNGGIDVGEIKNMIKNNKKGLEYIEIFCCSTDNTNKNKSFADVDNSNE